MNLAIKSAPKATNETATCPSGLQEKIKAVFWDCERLVYDDCNECGVRTTWATDKARIKPIVMKLGCQKSGAAQLQATSALFVVLAVAANHFFGAY